MISKDLIAASSRPLILSLLSKKESYGYEIIKNIQELSANEIVWKEGTLYPVLKKLCENKLIESTWKTVDGRKRKYYNITAAGLELLKEEQSQWQIVNWKQRLNSSNSLTSNDIDELESHLLDEIDSLKEKDLSEEEAFFVATSRLGSVDLLSSEFSKINTRTMYLKKAAWFISGYILIYFIKQLINSISFFLTVVIDKAKIIYLNVDNSAYSYGYSTLCIGISILFFLIFLYLLLGKKHQLLIKIQSVFSKFYNCNKPLLFFFCSVLIFMNSIGFGLLQPLMIRTTNSTRYCEIAAGNNIFGMVFSVILCLSLILILVRENKKEQTT